MNDPIRRYAASSAPDGAGEDLCYCGLVCASRQRVRDRTSARDRTTDQETSLITASTFV
jgi:hypothetical protein